MTGRNEPCACGSGKKTKHCCALKTSDASQSNKLGLVVGAIVVVGAIAAVGAIRDRSKGETPRPPAVQETALPAASVPSPSAAVPAAPAHPVATPGPQPAGPAPAGKVWSKEHGHWHDKVEANEWIKMSVSNPPAAPAATQGQPGAAAPVSIPQPDVPVPPGKVWSAEHGHWHDAATGVAPAVEIPPDVEAQMKPPGVPEAPPGMVWSVEHNHWHKAGAVSQSATTSTAPATTTNPK